MRSRLLLLFFWTCISVVFSQSNTTSESDSLYREDQLYVGVTYNALLQLPDGVTQNSFSTGLHLGLIRDFPLNKRRNIAIGLGLGYSFNIFNQNIKINASNTPTYTILSDDDYSRNNFSQHLIEVPLELRWRTSNAESYKFWRIYTGIKLGYLVGSKSVFDGASGRISNTNLEDLNPWQYGLTLSVGYNTWNGYIYYGLHPIFDKAFSENAQAIDMSALKIGLIFYML